MAATPRDQDLALEAALAETIIVGEARRRALGARTVSDRASGITTGLSLAIALLTWWIVAPPPNVALPLVFICIAAHAAASLVEFEIGPGSALPTTPVLILSAFLLPPQALPIVAIGGLGLSALVAGMKDPRRHERAAVVVGSAWHAMGLAAIFALTGMHKASLSQWPLWVAALSAQFIADAASSWVRNCYGLGVPTRSLLDALRFTFLVDIFLAPLGIAAALSAPGSALSLMFLLGPILLLGMLQRDRRLQVDRTVALRQAVSDTEVLARTDVLTGLGNRLAWEDALDTFSTSAVPVGVVTADVDGLKVANDHYGHSMGDRLIAAVASTIAAATPSSEHALVARIGGDEFGILLPGELAARTDEVGAAIRAELQSSSALDGVVAVRASIGWAVAQSGASLSTAFREADRSVNTEKIRTGARRM